MAGVMYKLARGYNSLNIKKKQQQQQQTLRTEPESTKL